MEWLKSTFDRFTHHNGSSIHRELTKTQQEQQSQLEFLRRVTYNDVPFFDLKAYETWARCIKIVDGDTVVACFFLHDKPYKFRVRLADIDTPEKTSKDPEEVKWSTRATERLRQLIGNELIYLKCHEWDKYGRLLAEVYHSPEEHESFNDILVCEGLACKYEGGHKKPFREWFKKDMNPIPPGYLQQDLVSEAPQDSQDYQD